MNIVERKVEIQILPSFFTIRYNKFTPMNGQENEDKENTI